MKSECIFGDVCNFLPFYLFQPSELKGVEVPVKCIHSATTCDFKKQNKIYQNDKGELDPFYRFTKFHLLFQEENGAAWISWLLDAIHKIKVKLAIRFIDFFYPNRINICLQYQKHKIKVTVIRIVDLLIQIECMSFCTCSSRSTKSKH